MGFVCKGRFRKQLVSWLYIKSAWLPAIAVCNTKLFNELPDPPVNIIPSVENYELTVDGKMTTQTWTPNDTYWIWAEVRINEGTWEPLGTNGPDSSSGSFYFMNTTPGDVLGFRLRFGDYGGTKFGPWNEQFVTIRNTRIFHSSGDLSDASVFSDGAIATEGQVVNFFVEESQGDYITIDHPENLFELYIAGQGLDGSLDLTRCENLTYLNCSNNNPEGQGIRSIDTSGLTNLYRISAQNLYALTDINVSGCTSLSELNVRNSSISDLDISGTSMSFFNLQNCENLASVLATDVTGSGGKAYFVLTGCNLDAEAINAFFTSLGEENGWKGLISIGGNPGARYCNPLIATEKGWSINGGPIKIFTGTAPVNLSEFQTVGEVTLMNYGNNVYIDDPESLTGFTLAESYAAGELNLLGFGSLTAIDIQSATGLTSVTTGSCLNISSFDARYCSSLISLYIDSNQALGSINLLGCSSLEIFSANNTPILTVENIPTSIVELYLQDQGQDGTLSLYGCGSLTLLYAPGCHTDNIDFTGCGNITTVNLNDCIYLTSLDMSDSGESLTDLDIANTAITSLSLTNFTSLDRISVRESNSLTAISVTECPLLRQFFSYSCPNLISVDVSDNNGLTHIYAQSCPSMTSIDISNDPSLQYVNVASGGLDASAIDNMFIQLPTYSGVVYVYGNPGVSNCDTTIATGKNWAFG